MELFNPIEGTSEQKIQKLISRIDNVNIIECYNSSSGYSAFLLEYKVANKSEKSTPSLNKFRKPIHHIPPFQYRSRGSRRYMSQPTSSRRYMSSSTRFRKYASPSNIYRYPAEHNQTHSHNTIKHSDGYGYSKLLIKIEAIKIDQIKFQNLLNSNFEGYNNYAMTVILEPSDFDIAKIKSSGNKFYDLYESPNFYKHFIKPRINEYMGLPVTDNFRNMFKKPKNKIYTWYDNLRDIIVETFKKFESDSKYKEIVNDHTNQSNDNYGKDIIPSLHKITEKITYFGTSELNYHYEQNKMMLSIYYVEGKKFFLLCIPNTGKAFGDESTSTLSPKKQKKLKSDFETFKHSDIYECYINNFYNDSVTKNRLYDHNDYRNNKDEYRQYFDLVTYRMTKKYPIYKKIFYNLYIIAEKKENQLTSIRDLDKKYLNLLKQCEKNICIFMHTIHEINPEELTIYFQYPPSITFCLNINIEYFSQYNIGRIWTHMSHKRYLLNDIICNIGINSNYYKKIYFYYSIKYYLFKLMYSDLIEKYNETIKKPPEFKNPNKSVKDSIINHMINYERKNIKIIIDKIKQWKNWGKRNKMSCFNVAYTNTSDSNRSDSHTDMSSKLNSSICPQKKKTTI